MFMKKMPAGIAILALAAFFCAQSSCKAGLNVYGSLGGPDSPIPVSEFVLSGVLPGGLTYYIVENKKPEDRAYIKLAVNAGSVLEEDGERGVAHFVEHLAFSGTKRFPGTELIEYLRSLGMSFGPHTNAYTSFDRTVYEITVPIGDKTGGKSGLPARALEIIDDWAQSVTFYPADVDKERPIILEEERIRSGAMNRAMRSLYPLVFEGSKYADRLPIGVPEVIRTVPAEGLKNFYKKWYRPDNMAIIFAGDFDGAALEREIQQAFQINEPDSPLDMPSYGLPPPEKGKINAKIFADTEITQSYVLLYYKNNWKPVGTSLKDYREQLIKTLISSMIDERFTERVFAVETPYNYAGAGEQRTAKRALHFTMDAAPKTGLVRESLAALFREKELIERYGFQKGEIERAKENLFSNLENDFLERDKKYSEVHAQALVEMFLVNNTMAGIEWEFNAAQILLPGITERDILKTVREYFAPDDLCVFVMANEKETLPSEEEIIELAVASKKENLKRPKEKALSGSLLDKKPQAGSVVDEGVDADTDSTLWTLSNGARVILKATENQNDQIVLSAAARGGVSGVPEEDIISVKAADEIASASGAGKWNRPDLEKKLAGKHISVSFNSSLFSRSIEGRSGVEDLQAFFELLYLYLSAPRASEDALVLVKDQYKSELAQINENPESLWNDEVTRTVYNSNPYVLPLQLADIDKIDLQTAADWIKKSRNPEDYTFVFVGNINLNDMRDFVETYIASIPAKNTFNESASPKITFPKDGADKPVFKGKEDKSLVYMGYVSDRPWNFKESIAADIAKEYLNIELTRQIREKMGGVYSISAWLDILPVPPPGEMMLQVNFGCSPQRVDELSRAVEAQLLKIARGGIDADTFESARLARIKEFESSLQNNSYIARRFVSYTVMFDLPLSYVYMRSGFYEAVEAENMRLLVEAALQNKLVRVSLYPQK